MVKHYPHTATISWYDAGTTNSVGVFSPGTLNTITIDCDIQPVSGRFVLSEGGAVLNYNWHIFADLFTGHASVPKTAELDFFSEDHVMVQLFPYQKHVEIKCRD